VSRVVIAASWCPIWLSRAVFTQGAAEVVGPLVGDFPGDEVSAVVVGGDVDVVVPGGAVAVDEALDTLLTRP